MNISQRLTLICSLLSAAIIAVVITSLVVISGFQTRFHYIQSNATASVIDLGKLVSGSNELTIWMYRHLTSPDAARMSDVEKEINARIDEMNALNQFYLENEISSDEDRRMTESAIATMKELSNKLPAFLESSRALNSNLSLALLQGNNGVGQLARDLIVGYKKQLQLNLEIGNGLRKKNDRTYFLNASQLSLTGIFSSGCRIFIGSLFHHPWERALPSSR